MAQNCCGQDLEMNPKPLRREGNLVREAMPKVVAARAEGGKRNASRAFGDRFLANRCAEEKLCGHRKILFEGQGWLPRFDLPPLLEYLTRS
jgi:hypothetical protein